MNEPRTSTPPNPTPAIIEPVQGPEPATSGTMSFFEHLEELRSRLLRSIFALIIGVAIAAVFTGDILKYLASPYEHRLTNPSPTGAVVMYFRVALMSGAILAIPYITYQLFMFVAPGLTKKERSWIYLALPATTGFFLLGVSFAWFIMAPAAFGFLQTFQSDVFQDQWFAEEYFKFLTSLLFWIGVAFEMPVFMFVLARLGLIGPKVLIRNWRFAVVAITIIAAIITPTVDPFNMLLVTAPLLMLYVLSIGLVAIAARRVQRSLNAPH
ncbi:MAG: twin-arginine translocase subunit TatC [Chloroflexi bacterium]|nr:twin-arginine translocase subunit TatC [Chloroflexota bacterium]